MQIATNLLFNQSNEKNQSKKKNKKYKNVFEIFNKDLVMQLLKLPSRG
jgi:hypothetical protein